MSRVSFIDTSVLCELLQVPGKCAGSAAALDELKARVAGGERFIIPVTTVIETGNHIAQATGDRRAAAKRFDDLLMSATRGNPFATHAITWDESLLEDLLGGATTGRRFVDLAGNGEMGGGDVAILVERDRYVAASSFTAAEVGVWTLEATLSSYAHK